MLKKRTEMALSDTPRSTKMMQFGRKPLAAAFLLLLFSCGLRAQSSKEFIYMPDGKMIASVAGEPTWLRFNTAQGFAGIDTAIVTVGNGAGMTIGIQWKFVSWGDQTQVSYESQIGPLASIGPIPVNGQIAFPIPQDSAPGTITVTAIKNVNGGSWIQLSQPSIFTVRPPKPTSSTFINPEVLQLPASPGTQRVHSANMKNQNIVVKMHIPQGVDADYTIPLNSGDPSISDNGGDWYSAQLPHGSVPLGDYNFISTRNALDLNPDAFVPWGTITPGPTKQTVVQR